MIIDLRDLTWQLAYIRQVVQISARLLRMHVRDNHHRSIYNMRHT